MTNEDTGFTETAPVAVISGAASGIGESIALALKSRGWKIASIDLREAPAADFSICADVTDTVVIDAAIKQIIEHCGPISGLVAAAGHYAEQACEEISTESWKRMLHVHVGGVLNLLQAVLPGMLERNSGRIVTIASERAIGGGHNDAHYAAAKGAALALMRSAAAEVTGTQIRINAVAPGPTDTPLLPADSWERQDDFLATLAVRRIATPAEIALTTCNLLEQSLFLHGEVISVNSGTVI